jgi:hypothetical protein
MGVRDLRGEGVAIAEQARGGGGGGGWRGRHQGRHSPAPPPPPRTGGAASMAAAAVARAVRTQSSRRFADRVIGICRQPGIRGGFACLFSTREPGVFRVAFEPPRWATGSAQVF